MRGLRFACRFLILVTIICGFSQALHASTIPRNAPRVVRQHLMDLIYLCSRSGGTFVDASIATAIVRHDLNGDGQPDWVIRDGAVDCRGHPAIYSGASGNSQVSAYIVRRNGSAFRAMMHGAFSLERRRTSAGWKVYVGVGGVLCGQRVTPEMPRSDYRKCLVPLRWEAANGRVMLADPAEALPYRR